jgi:hypothetical protein
MFSFILLSSLIFLFFIVQLYLSFRFHLLDEFNRRRRKSKPSDADAGDKKRAHWNKAAAAKDSTWYTSFFFFFRETKHTL